MKIIVKKIKGKKNKQTQLDGNQKTYQIEKFKIQTLLLDASFLIELVS